MTSNRIATSLSLLLAAALLVFTFAARANEGGGEGGGEGGEKKENPADKPWVETQNRVSALSTKTKQLEDRLTELIEEKKRTRDSNRMLDLDKEIGKVYRDYRDSNAELRRQEQIFKYRYPERAAREGERVYHTEEVPSLEKIEEQVGVEGKLQRNLLRMRSQYGTAKPKKKEAEKAAGESAHPNGKGEDEKNIREQDSLILKK